MIVAYEEIVDNIESMQVTKENTDLPTVNDNTMLNDEVTVDDEKS